MNGVDICLDNTIIYLWGM